MKEFLIDDQNQIGRNIVNVKQLDFIVSISCVQRMGNILKSIQNKDTTPPIQPVKPMQNNFQQDGIDCCVQGEQQSYKNYDDTSNSQRVHKDGGTLELLNDKAEDKNKKVVAVIVTLNNGGSYDCLFRNIQQKSLEGTKVQVYACDSHYINSLISAFEGNPKDDISIRLMNTIKQVDKDCVVFNWECCGGYSGKVFGEGADNLFKFLKIIIDKGHMAMFSDFSLKALINNWQQKYQLGPNPFVQTSQHTGNFEIRFKTGELKQCPSAQLQIIGEMCEEGRCNILAAGGTIVYCVDSDKVKNKAYKLEVLTVVSTLKAPKNNYKSKIGSQEGTAGHVLLRYPSGGMILTSMGHWIELMKIDTSEKKLFEIAERQYGVSKAQKMKQVYSKMNEAEQLDYIQCNAKQFVRNQAPCTNMNKKSRR